MTIHIKHVSGGCLRLNWQAVQVELAAFYHESLADKYRERYAAVPVKVRKHRNLEVGSDLKLAHMQAYAHKFVTARAKLQAEYL